VEQIAADHVHAVCISALSSQSTMRAIAWARVLRHHFPELVIVLGHWNRSVARTRRMELARSRYGFELVTSLKEAVVLLAPAEIPIALALAK
jgi:hypothetical protein